MNVWVRDEQWLPVDVPAEHCGTVESVVAALSPSTSKRYQPRTGATWCNIFVWDVTRALKCEIPHWYNPATDKATSVGHGIEMTANSMHDWLERRWTEATLDDAIEAVGRGHTVVAAWKNPGGIGHVAVLLGNGCIAQAGASCFECGAISAGFGKHNPSFFVSPGPHSGATHEQGA